MTLDAFQHARERNGPTDGRHAITHLELIDPADIPRFRALGVAANFEALWANGDEYLTRLTEPALGPTRSALALPDRERGSDRSGRHRRQRLVGIVA
jgi:predicted amidohydrolase YtcJ